MTRRYDLQSIQSFFDPDRHAAGSSSRNGTARAMRYAALSQDAALPPQHNIDDWLDARLRELYGAVLKEELPREMVEKVMNMSKKP